MKRAGKISKGFLAKRGYFQLSLSFLVNPSCPQTLKFSKEAEESALKKAFALKYGCRNPPEEKLLPFSSIFQAPPARLIKGNRNNKEEKCLQEPPLSREVPGTSLVLTQPFACAVRSKLNV